MAQVTVEIYDYEHFNQTVEKYGLIEVSNKSAPWGGNEITVEGDTPTLWLWLEQEYFPGMDDECREDTLTTFSG